MNLRIGLAAALLAAVLGVSAAQAQTVHLSVGPDVAKGSAALPRIASPATPATARINAALGRLDRSWAGYVRDCLAGGKDNEAGRHVDVSMRGPRYLSLQAWDEEDCGGAHPDNSLTALTYDLETGRPVDWKQLLGSKLAAQTSVDNVIDGTTIGLVSSPELRRLYVQTLKASAAEPKDWWSDCADVLAADDLSFSLWLDAKKHAVAVRPELEHVVLACAEEADIAPATLHEMGASPELLAAFAR